MSLSAKIRSDARRFFAKSGQVRLEKRKGIVYFVPLYTHAEFAAKCIELAKETYPVKNPPKRDDGTTVSPADWRENKVNSLAGGCVMDSFRHFCEFAEFNDDGKIVGGTDYVKKHGIKAKRNTIENLMESEDFVKMIDHPEKPGKTVHVYLLPKDCRSGKKGKQAVLPDASFDDLEIVDETEPVAETEPVTETEPVAETESPRNRKNRGK